MKWWHNSQFSIISFQLNIILNSFYMNKYRLSVNLYLCILSCAFALHRSSTISGNCERILSIQIIWFFEDYEDSEDEDNMRLFSAMFSFSAVYFIHSTTCSDNRSASTSDDWMAGQNMYKRIALRRSWFRSSVVNYANIVIASAIIVCEWQWQYPMTNMNRIICLLLIHSSQRLSRE